MNTFNFSKRVLNRLPVSRDEFDMCIAKIKKNTYLCIKASDNWTYFKFPEQMGSSLEIDMSDVGTNFTTEKLVWKKVTLSDTTSEQTFTTRTSPLTVTSLSSGQTAIPYFNSTDKVKVVIDSPYQDRFVYISTEPTITSGNVTFGVKLSNAGVSGTPYFDISIERYSS